VADSAQDDVSELASGTATRTVATTRRVEVRAARASVLVGALLLVTKFVAYGLTGSAAIFSDALESVVNVAAAVMAVWALSLAHRPADHSHPYGHGKAEFISAALEGGMILLAAVAGAAKGVDVLLHNRLTPSPNLITGLMLMIAALVVNGVVGGVLLRLGSRNRSLALEADGRHLLADALTSLAAVVALVIVHTTGQAWVDPVAALVVSVWIAITGASLIRTSIAGLMDETDVADDALLRAILDAHVGLGGKEPMICSYHKLRHRHSVRYHWVDFHHMVPAPWDIRRGHEVASALEFELETALGEGNATAHVEPCEGDRQAICTG
jgi:cation diffusion facilitator family transporter